MRLLAHPHDPDRAAEEAAAVLAEGGVAVIPTDTVYGLACLPSRPSAIARVYDLKGRPRERRLPVIVSSLEGAEALGVELGSAGTRAASAFWPGALTIAAPVHAPKVAWLDGRDEVAIRVPAAPLARRLAELAGPFLMTSANAHGAGSRPGLEAVLAELAGEPELAVDGGELSVVSSTLLNVNLPEPAIEREGAIPAHEVARALHG